MSRTKRTIKRFKGLGNSEGPTISDGKEIIEGGDSKLRYEKCIRKAKLKIYSAKPQTCDWIGDGSPPSGRQSSSSHRKLLDKNARRSIKKGMRQLSKQIVRYGLNEDKDI